jgi:hypothetical protein
MRLLAACCADAPRCRVVEGEQGPPEVKLAVRLPAQVDVGSGGDNGPMQDLMAAEQPQSRRMASQFDAAEDNNSTRADSSSSEDKALRFGEGDHDRLPADRGFTRRFLRARSLSATTNHGRGVRLLPGSTRSSQSLPPKSPASRSGWCA